MKSRHLTRRLLGGLVGLAVGVSGALALAAPAQATEPAEPPAPEFQVTCDGTYFELADAAGGEWSVTTGGEAYWPGDDDVQPGAEGVTLFVPGGSGEVAVFYDPGEGEPVEVATHTWVEESYCQRIPGPTHTQPTCDTPGTVTIPDFPVDPAEPPSDTDGELTSDFEEAPVLTPPGTLPTWQLNSEPVETGTTHEVEPGTQTVELVFEGITIKTWVIEIEEPDCPDEPGEPGEPDDPGQGGELPKTGTTTGIIAASAGLLLAIGAGLFLLARRRRITFTA